MWELDKWFRCGLHRLLKKDLPLGSPSRLGQNSIKNKLYHILHKYSPSHLLLSSPLCYLLQVSMVIFTLRTMFYRQYFWNSGIKKVNCILLEFTDTIPTKSYVTLCFHKKKKWMHVYDTKFRKITLAWIEMTINCNTKKLFLLEFPCVSFFIFKYNFSVCNIIP